MTPTKPTTGAEPTKAELFFANQTRHPTLWREGFVKDLRTYVAEQNAVAVAVAEAVAPLVEALKMANKVRLKALQNVAYSLPPEEERGQLAYAFLLHAHRVLATGDSYRMVLLKELYDELVKMGLLD